MGDYMKYKVEATAKIAGSSDYRGIKSKVTFTTATSGVLVTTHILGFPVITNVQKAEFSVFTFTKKAPVRELKLPAAL